MSTPTPGNSGLPTPAILASPATPGFPDDRSLCEQCGYSLRGLSPAGSCPECGASIFSSDPVHRPGLPFQDRASPRTFLATLRLITFHPGKSFRALRVNRPGESPWRQRLYLLIFTLLIALFWGIAARVGGLSRPLAEAAGVALAVLALTYIEILGVAFFSQRRGWPVALALAERVTCYSAGAWIPAGLVMFKVRLLQQAGFFLKIWPPAVVAINPYIDILCIVLIGALSILWFESLVWLGVRQVKFANAPPALAPLP